MTSEEQLRRWVAGEPIHRGSLEAGECCPDFSCCRPELLAPTAERERFARATEGERERMLASFLRKLLEASGVHAHVAGSKP